MDVIKRRDILSRSEHEAWPGCLTIFSPSSQHGVRPRSAGEAAVLELTAEIIKGGS
jgi:hypothetical protein